MHYSRIALAATPILFAYVSAYGSAIIKNSCADDVYVWSCADTPGDMTTIKGGSSHPEKYYAKKEGGGISLKIGVKYASGPKAGQIPGIWDQPAPNMTQFEYTVGTPGPPANAVFYDISNINGYPFVAGGVRVTSSDDSVKVNCPKGVEKCKQAYNVWNDDHATGSTGDHVDLTMELCSEAPGLTVGGLNAGSIGSSGGSSGSSQEGSDESSNDQPEPAPSSTTPAPAPAPTSSPAPASSSETHHNHVAAPNKLAVANLPEANNVPSKPENADFTVIQTVTAEPVVVTVEARSGHKKRHDHGHQHVHNKINKKRHDN